MSGAIATDLGSGFCADDPLRGTRCRVPDHVPTARAGGKRGRELLSNIYSLNTTRIQVSVCLDRFFSAKASILTPPSGACCARLLAWPNEGTHARGCGCGSGCTRANSARGRWGRPSSVQLSENKSALNASPFLERHRDRTTASFASFRGPPSCRPCVLVWLRPVGQTCFRMRWASAVRASACLSIAFWHHPCCGSRW